MSGATERLLANLDRRNIPGLNGLRGVCALSVVAYHSWSEYFPGRMAVQIFFVISGFLITWLLLREDKRYSRINRKAFYIRRGSRVLPALLVLLAWEWFTDFPHAPKAGVIAAALYYANYYLMSGAPLAGISQTWSLAVEEHFYLIWPHVFFYIKNHKMLMYSCFAAAVIEVFWRVASAQRIGYLYATFATDTSSSAVLCGCGLAFLITYYPTRLPRFAFSQSAGVVSIVAILLLAQLPEHPQSIWGLPAAIPFACILVLQAITYEWRVLDNTVGQFLGRISYGVYLWGFVAPAFVRRFGHSLKHMLVFVIAIVLGAVSHYAIEKPVQSLARRWMARRVDGPAAALAAS